MRYEAEVAIVGGGPAGCAAALSLRSRGRTTVVVDAPGKKLRPTETAAPRLRDLLNGLGAGEVLTVGAEPCYGLSSNWGRHKSHLLPSILNPFGSAWFVHRKEFDREMQSLVQRRGASWLTAVATKIHVANDGVMVEAGSHTIAAKWIIDVSGSEGRIGLQIGRRHRVIDRLVVFWAQLSVDSALERVLSVEATNQGWWYLCPGRTSEAFACLVTDSRTAKSISAHIPANWSSLLGETHLLTQARDIMPERIRVASFGVGHCDPLFGVRWIAAGDAALHLDPLGSSGLVTALESGRRAAEAVMAAIQGEPSLLQTYSDWGQGLINEFIKQRLDHYQLEGSRSEFWQRRLGLAAVQVR